MTRPPAMPADLRRFIVGNIPSVPYLEAALLLRADPAMRWDQHSLARRLYLPEVQAFQLLRALADSGIAEIQAQDPLHCSFRPATAELAEMMDLVAAHYSADLVGVTDLIHSRTDKRAKQFAAAFRWRKDT